MKKTKIVSMVCSLFFMGIFFVKVDGSLNVAKAETYQECYSGCIDGGTDGPTCQGGCSYLLNADSTPTVKEVTQADCDAYGTGYVVNSAGTDCIIPAGLGGVTQKDCDAYGSGYVVNAAGTDCVANGTTGVTQADCDAYGTGYVVNSAGTDCIASNGKGQKGDGCAQPTSWYSMDTCAMGLTCNATGTCEASTLGNLTGFGGDTGVSGKIDSIKTSITAAKASVTASGISIPAGSKITTNGNGGGTVTMPSGQIISIPPSDMAAIANSAVGGSPAFLTVPTYPGSVVPAMAKCGANFQDIGGVCFPTNTGLSSAPITTILGNLFSWLMGLFTTLAVLAFVVSGIQYFLSAGDESMAESAKDNAKNALIGIVVGLSGFIIIQAVASALSGNATLF